MFVSHKFITWPLIYFYQS